MKKVKRVFTATISMLLVLVILFNLVACTAPWQGGEENGNGNGENNLPGGTVDIDEIVPVVISLAQKQPLVNKETEKNQTITADKLVGFGTSLKADKIDGLTKYDSSAITVVYDTNADQYGIVDTITVNDAIVVEQGYYVFEDDKTSLSTIYAEYYEVEIDYTDDGKVEGLYYYDRYYIYHYDSNGRLIDIYCNGELYKAFTYNSNGNIVKEVSVTEENAFEKTYAYTESGELYSTDNKLVDKATLENSTFKIGENTVKINAGVISSVNGEVNGSFKYEYTFEGSKYITSKTVDGITTTYKYVGDKIVELKRENETVSYILDKDLNYVGLSYMDTKYYFAVDPFGAVMGLVDCDGNSIVEYQYDIWGNVTGITGSLKDTVGVLNEVINLNGIYDHNLKAYFFADNVYFAENGITVNNTNVNYAKNIYEWEQSNYFARSAVSSFAQIHDKVVEVAVENLKDSGVDTVSNLYAIDKNGDSRRLVDIYTLDYSITPFSTKNLLNGNQIYEVIYHAPESDSFETIASNKLTEIINNWSVSYFGEYSKQKTEAQADYLRQGTMSFHGQFVFLDYLIDYKCEGNGIIEYQVLANVKTNYNQSINIYDYDQEKYICYVNNTFDLNFLDGVTIIPGINQEQYDAIDGYISGYLQAVAGNICDQMLIYDDPNYYDLENMNVTEDYWSQMNLEDTTTYLEIQGDGSISVEVMPVWETDGFATKLLIGAGVILVTAIVATIAISIPGLNCVVVSICVGAAKGAVAGALSGVAMGFVQPLIGITIEGVATGNWDFSNYFEDALSAAADGFASGAVTGAIMGGISGGLNPKYCFEAGTPVITEKGAVAIENVVVGDMVWSYDYKTGEKSLKPVTATTVRETNQVISVKIGGEQIVTTPEHPFYVVNNDKYNGYVAAKYLSVGDCIQTADGEYLEITAIEQQTLDTPMTVYNLTVDDNHSYYVGDNELLVHNLSCNDSDIGTYKNLRKTSKGTGNEVHHIVEKRFAQTLGIDNTDDMLSITLSKSDHLQFTRAWRSYLPTGHTYTKDQILSAAKEIYKNYPALLDAALKTIG